MTGFKPETELDHAYEAMMRSPEDQTSQLAYYHRFADAELCLLLESDADGDRLTPAVFELAEGRFVLAFDSDDRLASFSDTPMPFVALPGRVIVAELARQAIGVGVNLGVSESAFLMPAGAVDWLADALAAAPREGMALPVSFAAVSTAGLAGRLEEKLKGLGHLANAVWLAEARHADGRIAMAVVFADARPEAEAALAKTAGEVVQFAGFDPAGVDVLFLNGDQVERSELSRVGQRVVISAPKAVEAIRVAPLAPGSDPDKPPILR
jgi:hypothetical protein